MVLHRVLAGSARTFLLNDMGDELLDETKRCQTVGALNILMQTRPVWAQSAASELDGSQRPSTQTERIHQSRVAMRRIRSNLRTFRLLLDPAWGTSLRAELSWYGNCLGQARDLHIIGELITRQGGRRHRARRTSPSSSRSSPSGWPAPWRSSAPSAAGPAASS